MYHPSKRLRLLNKNYLFSCLNTSTNPHVLASSCTVAGIYTHIDDDLRPCFGMAGVAIYDQSNAFIGGPRFLFMATCSISVAAKDTWFGGRDIDVLTIFDSYRLGCRSGHGTNHSAQYTLRRFTYGYHHLLAVFNFLRRLVLCIGLAVGSTKKHPSLDLLFTSVGGRMVFTWRISKKHSEKSIKKAIPVRNSLFCQCR